MSYGQFAKTYQSLMDKSLYAKWQKYVMRHVKTGSSLLELACGTGELANLLQRDYAIVASDVSEDMLVIARETAPNLSLWQADMLDLSAFDTFDAIVCFADSICYLKNEKEVQQAFQQAHAHLNDKGYYLFDVHSIYQMTHHFKEYCYQYVDDTMVFTWQTVDGEEMHTVEHELTCCQQLPNGLYERYDEVHKQRTYALQYYLDWLKQAGFRQVTVTSDFGMATVTEHTTRWFFACQK